MYSNRGSPPRVRGTGVLEFLQGIFARITPACAGNRTNQAPLDYLFRDHPRVCGEQSPSGRLFRFTIGSPPRVRGTAHFVYVFDVVLRITPACAGNRLFLWCLRLIERGSPPRVRGTVDTLLTLRAFDGITPACAGNRSAAADFPVQSLDHPRVCGEQPNHPLAPNPVKGSPPRVRGTGSAWLE